VQVGREKQHEMYLSAKAKLQMASSKQAIEQYRRGERERRGRRRDELEEYGQVVQNIRQEQKLASLRAKLGQYRP
jgi:hypothetical protein